MNWKKDIYWDVTNSFANLCVESHSMKNVGVESVKFLCCILVLDAGELPIVSDY
jgi:hypothetical protein